MDPYVPLDIQIYQDASLRPAQVKAIRELPLRLSLNGRDLVTLQCTGLYPEYLAAGYLFACGLIERAADIAKLSTRHGASGIEVEVELLNGLRPEPAGLSLSSALGRDVLTQGAPGEQPIRPGLAPVPVGRAFLPAQKILELGRELHERSQLYRLTRGCHNCSLCSLEGMLIFRSDIGRHNAIDTILGQCLLEGVGLSDKLLVSTGRIASEIVYKAARAGVGVYASIAVATSQAVEMARALDLTLIGNLREQGFWVYNDPGRLLG